MESNTRATERCEFFEYSGRVEPTKGNALFGGEFFTNREQGEWEQPEREPRST